MILTAVLVAGWQGRFEEITKLALDAAEGAVMKLALPLSGAMSIWLGMMRLAEKGGFVQAVAKLLRPALARLFPDVPPNHPAMGAMVMNMAANFLGLGNAATPLGLRAMRDLERLNPHPGTATNAMCTFLAVNTSSIQLVPFTAISVLAVNGSIAPTAIVGSSILATTCSTIAGIVAVKLLERMPIFRLCSRAESKKSVVVAESMNTDPDIAPREAQEGPLQERTHSQGLPEWIWKATAVALAIAALILICRTAEPAWFGFSSATEGVAAEKGPFVRWIGALSLTTVPIILAAIPLLAAARGVPVYEEFVEGAKEGIQVALRIIPYLVAMLVAIAMFRGAGCIDWLTGTLTGPLTVIGFPPELLPMALMRPLSGSGTMSIFQDLVKVYGADSLIVRTAGTVFGSTETTFYVVALYFGSVGIRRTRHAIPAGLIADATGVVASIAICRMLFP